MSNPDNKERWGLPDWRDPMSYGGISKWSDDRWRWEFTRRRKDYREDFELERSRNAVLAESLREADSNLIVGDASPNETAVSAGLAKKYGFVFQRLPNPSVSEHLDHAITFDDYSARIYYFGPNISDRVPVPKGNLAVILDLSKPWGKSQRDKIEASYKEAQADWIERTGFKVSRVRAHKNTWRDYLRVLDARECRASWNEIAQTGLSDDASNAQKAWRAANRLMLNWPASLHC